LLLSASFTVVVDSFPPADYIQPNTQSFFDSLSTVIFVLSLLLLLMSLLVVPRKYAVHSSSISWLPAYLYLIYFHSTSYTNEWVSSSLTNIQHIALQGGFSLGDCCYHDSFKGLTS
jgi:uncharacterized membrane protein YozB (DUF420 family)